MSESTGIVELLERLRRLDVRLSVDDGRLRVSAPPGVLTSDLQQEIRDNKPALIDLLQPQPGAGADGEAPIARQEPGLPCPLSFTQERMWVLHELEPASTAYHVIQADRFRGPLDVPALERAWHRLAARQDVLRTRIETHDGVPAVVVDERLQPDAFQFDDVSEADAGAVRERANALLKPEVERPFDLARGPLARLVIVRVGPDDHIVLLRLHHIVTDHWSQGLIRHELAALYQSERTGEPDGLSPLPVRYTDYAAWQRDRLQGPAWDRLLAYWRGQLTGLEPLDLSIGQSQLAPIEAGSAGQTSVALPAGLIVRLTAVGVVCGASLFMVMLTAFGLLLHHYTARRHLPVGIPVAGRARRELEPIVGAFINTLVLRLDVRPTDRVQSLIDRVRQVTLDAMAHQDAPFERLVAALVPARDAATTPLVQVMFNLLTAHRGAATFPGVTVEPVTVDRHGSTLDLSLIVDAASEHVTAEYRRRQMFGVDVTKLLAHYVRLLESIAADPSQLVSALPMLGDDERDEIEQINDTRVPFDRHAGVETLVRQQAEQRPDAIAVRSGGKTLTYRELDQRAHAVAATLRAFGVGPDTLVGVCLQRSDMVPVALLGVLHAGGAYLPLDPDYPPARLRWMIEDSGVPIVLTDAASAAAVPAGVNVRVIDVDDIASPRAGVVDRGTDDRVAPAAVTGEHLAYVLYTSGSTGRPKGVQIPRRALTNLILATQQRPGMTAQDVLVAVTTFSFDIAGLELFLPLSVGGTVVIAERQETIDGHALRRLLTESGATVMQATPVTWRLLLDAGWDGQPPLKVLCGGERFPSDLAEQLTARSAEVWNMYGPTETTIWSTAERVRAGAPLGIGAPLANTDVYVLDRHGRLLPPGVPGELHIGGDGLARGYLGRPDLTARAFVPDRCSGRAGARLYRTGDLARLTTAGALEFLGRIDGQVKLRGFRIEPGEIEAALIDHDAIDQAAVIVQERGGQALLAAYFTMRGDAREPAPERLREHLLDRLPPYMVPSAFVRLDKLPLTPNGKIDRRALPEVDIARGASSGQTTEPRRGTEVRLAAVWAEILGVDRVALEDDFFALGGHSLLAMRLAAQVQRTFDVPMPPGVLFERPVLRDLAAWLEARMGRGRSPQQRVLVEIASGGGGVPFFWVHGVGGEVFSYMALSRQLGRRRPVFGFTADWTELADSDAITLEHMAERYVHEMRRAQPVGPYHLGGFCSAALLAMEMARQLEDLGEEVGLVAVLDYPVSPSYLPRRGLGGLSAFLRNLPRWYRDDAALASRGEMVGRLRSALGRLYGHMQAQGRGRNGAHRGPVDVRQQLGMWRFPDYQLPMLEAHHRALSSYRPRSFHGVAAVFLPIAAPLLGPWLEPGPQGWDEYAKGGLRVHLVRGSHSTMLSEPFAAALAELIDRELDDVEAALSTRQVARRA